jgi:NAD(P)-dependent dehydrogenase (short-subunit alcohol dehydrogenase family)
MKNLLEGKVALVTGCGASGPAWGIGKAIAVLFAREGARILGCDINPSAAQETQAIIAREGGECRTYLADVTNAEQAVDNASAARPFHARNDVFARQKAATAPPKPPCSASPAPWRCNTRLCTSDRT